MTGRTRSTVQFLVTGTVMMLLTSLFGLTAAAEVVSSTPAPTSEPFTTEDLARSGGSMSKWLWIAAPFAIGALWFGLNRLWRTPAVRS